MQRFDLVLVCLLSLSFSAGRAFAVEWAALPDRAPAPANNPTTPAKIQLGRMLFYDKRLSENGSVACIDCHILNEGGADHQTSSIGLHGERDGRNAPTVWNVGFLTSLFWDGRAATLEDQAKAQMLNPLDMGMPSMAYVTARLRSIAGYKRYFEEAFGHDSSVTAENATYALAAFERSLITNKTAYDRYAAGDKTALNEQQLRGMASFQHLGCARCHQGAAFDGPVMNAGIAFTMKFPTYPRSPFVATYELTRDQGRIEWTGKEADRMQWRVPSLRNLKYTAPYFHNGSVPTLSHAVRVMGSTELGLTLPDSEVADLVAFLETLSDTLPTVPTPTLPD